MSERSENPGKDRLIWMYRQMVRIREFEERVKRTFVLCSALCGNSAFRKGTASAVPQNGPTEAALAAEG